MLQVFSLAIMWCLSCNLFVSGITDTCIMLIKVAMIAHNKLPHHRHHHLQAKKKKGCNKYISFDRFLSSIYCIMNHYEF